VIAKLNPKTGYPVPSFPHLLLAAALLAAPATFAAEPKEAPSHVHFYVAGAGLILLAGGGAFAYYQNREADHDMAIYRNSAFTENTSAYKAKVETHQHLTWAGLAGATMGGILLVVSF
jgi:hypothetical protein